MKLPNPLSSLTNKKPKIDYLLSILLRDEKITAVIIEESEGKIKIVGKNEELLSTNLEQTPVETWIQILDQVITKAEETIPANAETSKTVFGVKDDWVEEKKIQKDYLAKLKSVCDALSLSPIGFLVISEAIAHLIQEEEGAPLNAILAEIGTKELTVTLFRNGKILEVKHGAISTSVPGTVDTLLKQFTSVEVLPTRIIVFDGERGEALAQEFISYQWSKQLPFLHMPQISLLPIGFDAKAVVYGAATQMGLEIVGSIIDKTQDIKTFNEGEQPPQQATSETPLTVSSESPIPSSASPHDTASGVPQDLKGVTAENFGFVENEDISLTPHPQTTSTPQENNDTEPFSPTLPTQPSPQTNPAPQTVSPPAVPTSYAPVLSISPLDSVRTFFSTLKDRLPHPSLPGGRSGGIGGIVLNKFIVFPILIIIIILLLIGAYFYFGKAKVTLNAKAKEVSANKEITFALGGQNDFSSDTIAASTISVSLQGNVSTNTTGQKEVGDQAKGNVTIYNSGSSTKQLSAGTTITSSNGLNFTLDKDVTIASASGDIFSGIKSGTATVAVTAEKIGPDYNLPSGSKFAVGNNSTLAGKNDSAFSGGSKKTVQVVAKKDKDTLLTQLPKSLADKAQDELKKKISSDEVILPITIDPTVSEKQFDKKENDEAKKISLSATVEFDEAVYKKDDLLSYAKERLKDQATDQQTVSDQGIANDLQNIKKTDNTITAQLAVKANLLPKIDNASLSKEIAGKSFTAAVNILKQEPQIDSVTIATFPSIPFLKFLPLRANNIAVQLTSHD